MPFKNIQDKQEYQREYQKRWYANPENAKTKKACSKKHRALQRTRNRKFLVDYKSNLKCKCGENRPHCLDFHHKDDNKEGNISEMVVRMFSIKRIKKEIEKCDVVCKNCHADLHWKEKQMGG